MDSIQQLHIDSLTKTCRLCGQTFSLTEFYAVKTNRDGLSHQCRFCDRQRSAQSHKKLRQDPEWREKRREYFRRYNYGLEPEQFATILASQGGVCAICKQRPDDVSVQGAHVDHDHATGQIRGILCNGCNRGLGLFRDRPDILRSAADYIEKHRKDGNINQVET